jgi:pimeloyl-ACP methyl ester carboxylesterase
MQVFDDQSSEDVIMFSGHGGVRIAASRAGPIDGLPICLLHGGGQTRYSWRAALHTLASQGFLALSLDLRGHGESDWSDTGDYHINHYVEDVRAIVSTLEQPPILVGASLGGISSLLLAGEAGGVPISGLVLVDVSPNMRREGSSAILNFMLGTSDGFDSLDEAADAVTRYLPHRERPRNYEGLRKNLRKHSDGRLRWHWDPKAFHRTFDSADISARMMAAAVNITAPAILLRGEHSELVTSETGNAFMALFEEGRVVDIAGAHHMVAGDRNDRFNVALAEFAESIRMRIDGLRI